jgi:dimethylargininase
MTLPAVARSQPEDPMAKNSALVRRPSPRLTEGLVTHIERQPIDVDLAMLQWQGYVDALQSNGWSIIEVPPADDCPDGTFIEDAVVVFGPVAIITRPGDHSRRPEIIGVEPVVNALGYRVERIVEPGTLDGGDVLKVGTTVYVGRGGRTNREGIEQLERILQPLGATVVSVPISKVLHLKSAVTALPDGTIIGWQQAVDDPSIFPDFLPVPEESGAHVVLLDDHRLLMAADAPHSAAMFAERGYQPVMVDIGEFIKLEGCVTCLSVRCRS